MFGTVRLLGNLNLYDELCLRDSKNDAFQVHHRSPLQASKENVTLCERMSRKLFLIG